MTVRKCLYLYLSQITGAGRGAGNSHLILEHLCCRYFSDTPYSCIHFHVHDLYLNLNILLVKRQIDNSSPGAVTGGN